MIVPVKSRASAKRTRAPAVVGTLAYESAVV
jgi:hypothetical protein